MSTENKNFRLQGTHIFLTYARANFALADLMSFLRNLNIGTRKPVRVIVAHELHKDGFPHRHAYIKYSGRIDCRNYSRYDFAGFHPKAETAKNVAATINYVQKDNEFFEWNDDGELNPTTLFEIANSMTYEEYFNHCYSNKVPYMYAKDAWKHVHGDVSQVTFDEDPNQDLAFPLIEPLSKYRFSIDLTNVIIGPSGIGKTLICLRMMVKPILFVSHIDQLALLDPSRHKSILMDDMVFSHLPLQAQIHLCDRTLPRAIHRRYGTTLIPSGIQVTITCNEVPFIYHPAIARRCNRLLIN